MDKHAVFFMDPGLMGYQAALDYQESLLQDNVQRKTLARQAANLAGVPSPSQTGEGLLVKGSIESLRDDADTRHYLLFVEHPPVYTLGKSGNIQNVLL